MPKRNIGVLCFAHLRWSFVYQRPQHVMARLARRHETVYWEEPLPASDGPTLEIRQEGSITVATPRLPESASPAQSQMLQRRLLDEFLDQGAVDPPVLWYYTPMALEFTNHLAGIRVYDCMDELATFKDAPSSMGDRERELIQTSALVFTGGRSLYYAKRHANPNVHCFPSGVDASHFRPAGRPVPEELRGLPKPWLGFYGVIDERFDTAFVEELARELSDWQLILIGPVVKIDAHILPQASNVHYLGMRAYESLPAYLDHWDVALLPFALNAATRYISPTKTLEYLAARKPIISTAIADVVDPYGAEGLVHIARTGSEAAAIARSIYGVLPAARWYDDVDRIVSGASWDATVANMERLLAEVEAAALQEVG